jgi:lysophospholipase L1-like esterase
MTSFKRPARAPAFVLALSGVAFLATAAAPQTPTAQEAPFALRDGDRVVFYGDSITQDGGYGRFVEEYVRTRFPDWDVRFYNAGVGGDTVKGGHSGTVDTRLDRDVIALRPTVVTVMLGMNDGRYRPFDPVTFAAYAEGLRAILDRLREALPGIRLTLIRPSSYDDIAREPQFAPGYDDVLRRFGCYVATLAGRGRATEVDSRLALNAGLSAVRQEDPALARLLIPDRVHPGPAGHIVLGAALLRAWHARARVTRVVIDASAPRVVVAEGTDVSALAATPEGLTWTQIDRALPLPLRFEDADVDLASRAGADLGGLDSQPLRVDGLAVGPYELTIDGRPIATLSAAELASGVDLARRDTPMRSQSYAVKWSVADSLEIQRVRRRLLVAAETDPALAAVAEALAEQDEAAQRGRRDAARPKTREYRLTRRGDSPARR